MTEQTETIDYTNWRGERRQRRIVPCGIIFSSNKWHPEPQWLLLAKDEGDSTVKTFAMVNIHTWGQP